MTVKRLEEFDGAYGGAFKRVRAGLGVTSFGIAVIDIPPGFDAYPEHDHSGDGQEEVYTALSGRATITIGGEGGEEHTLEPDTWIRVPSGVMRKVVTGDEPVRMLALGGTPGVAFEPQDWTEEGGAEPPA